MHTTLIYPGITDCGFASSKGNEGSWINHGLCLLSACLKRAGHQVSLIDLRQLSGWPEFENIVKASDLGVVGITVMSCDYNIAMQCAELIKKHKPQTQVVVGGPHPSIMPEEFEADPRVDHIFIGEGEVTFPELVSKIEKGIPVERTVRGVAPDLDSIPFADRELFGLEEEPFVPILSKPFVTIIAGRGCIYNCSYCQPAERLIFGKGVRRRSPENVIAELKQLRDKYAFKSMMIHDDCLTEDKKWVMRFCELYKKEGFNQPFVCQSRPDIVCKNEDMVAALKKAGLALVILGLESGSDRMLKFLRKGTTVAYNLKAASICHKYGIKIWANYMLGLPTETKEEQMQTYEMLKKIRPYHCSPAYYTPHPGSDLFSYGLEHDLHLLKDHASYRRNRYEPKIRGIDYEFLETILRKSFALGETQRNTQGITRSYIPFSLRKKVKAFINVFRRT
ncbi:MAG: radical SAM protein [Candidatus Omnitrophica bacterium]|nr:radical SAM protein [Candidatus Omnitrophota bacterium]MDD5610423.1 radical SAM protein [Candidatus Omnitrophota bacterium]